MLYLGALPSAFRLRDLLKQAFVSFSQYLGMETQMRSCDTTNSVCPQGLSQVASLCADKIMKFGNGTRIAVMLAIVVCTGPCYVLLSLLYVGLSLYVLDFGFWSSIVM